MQALPLPPSPHQPLPRVVQLVVVALLKKLLVVFGTLVGLMSTHSPMRIVVEEVLHPLPRP